MYIFVYCYFSMQPTPWTSSDTEILFSFLNYAPDIPSCDLAIFCRRACYEVFGLNIIKNIFEDMYIYIGPPPTYDISLSSSSIQIKYQSHPKIEFKIIW
jgi:hypothetical protein